MGDLLLHPELCDRVPGVGQEYLQLLTRRAEEVRDATFGMADPDVSIVIRSRDERERLEGLLRDVHSQLFKGRVEVVVVESGSVNRTREVAGAYGASVTGIDQSGYSHPKALNAGFEATSHPYVFTFVAHSNLTTTLAFRALTRWANQPGFAGAYGPAALPDQHATFWERRIARAMKLQDRLVEAGPVEDREGGIMVTHRAAYFRNAWAELGGFDERFGAGGEDTDMARRMLASGMTIVREPALSIYHSHHLGWAAMRRQQREYRRFSDPHPFDPDRLGFRKSLAIPK